MIDVLQVNASLGIIEPMLIVTGVAILLLIADLLLPQDRKHWSAAIGLAGVAWALARTLPQWGMLERGYADMVVLDNLSTFFNVLFLCSTALVIFLSGAFLRREQVEQPEYYALLLFATAGMMMLASGLDLITLFLGIEVMSIALYILAGYRRDSDASNEAAMKYFLLGAFASACLLYGIALTYGATGTTNLVKIADTLSNFEGPFPAPMLLAGVALVLVGFGFKVAAAPFHMWAPDVYHGAPTPITAFMSAGPKAAAFVAFLRVFFIAYGPIQDGWSDIVAVVAAITMTVGNIAAIAQTNIKRMLAYSSIAHSGYILIGLVAGGSVGGTAAIFYLLAYIVMNIGAFAVVIAMAGKGEQGEELKDYAGLGFRYPALGALLALFMISLSGIPPTVGFVGKLYLFGSAVNAGYIWLAVLGVLNSAISVFYYMRLLVLMYMREPAEDLPPVRVPLGVAVTLVLTGAATLGAGLFPGRWFEMAREGIRALFS
jgi:NADH-quinone oxidoreductase subunit N